MADPKDTLDVVNQMLYRQAVQTLPASPQLGVFIATFEVGTTNAKMAWGSNLQDRESLRNVLRALLRTLEAN